MHMTTSTRQVDGVTIVDITGRIVLGEECAALRDLISDLLSKGLKAHTPGTKCLVPNC
jgi:anti-sigma B factor antagonist